MPSPPLFHGSRYETLQRTNQGETSDCQGLTSSCVVSLANVIHLVYRVRLS